MTLWEDKIGKEERFMSFLRKWYLSRDPFSFDLPAPEAFVPSQREELLRLKQILIDGKVGVLTGDLGMGKTTVCEFLTVSLREESLFTPYPEKQVIPIFIHGAAYKSSEELLRATIHGLGLDAEKESATLFEFLRRWPLEHREKLAIIVDDVPESRADYMEIGEFFRVLADLPQISLLLNGEQGQMERFLEKIPALKDRIEYWVDLKPFSFEDLRDMLKYRIKYASVPLPPLTQHPAERLITPDGYSAIYEMSGGKPREAIKQASRALRLAAQLDIPVDGAVVKRANHKPWWRRLFREH